MFLVRIAHNVRYLFFWVCIITITGIVVGGASAFFLLTLEAVTRYREAHFHVIYALPIVGFAMSWVYMHWGKSVERGNNLIIENLHQPIEMIPFRMAPFIYVTTLLTHLFGGSAGREGTALQMAAGLIDQFSKPLRLSDGDRKTLLMAAVAAGFGSVFGTPLAGAVFAFEFYRIGELRYTAIVPIFSASIIADIVTQWCGATHTVYQVDFVPNLNLTYFFCAVIAGIFFGCCAFIFSQMMAKVGRFSRAIIPYAPLRTLLGGGVVVLGILLCGTKYIGLGIPTIVAAFHTPLPYYDFALKILFTVLTLAVGYKGGEVTPLFFVGATLGNALAYFIPLPIGLLSAMGFVAVFAGASNTPLACLLMGIELFGSKCGVFVAIACVVSYCVSGHTSIYNAQIIAEPKPMQPPTDKERSIQHLKA